MTSSAVEAVHDFLETRAALDYARGNRTRAARLLGVSRPTLHARIGRLGLAAWVASTWPSRNGPASTPVVEVRTEPGVRVYVLAAHGEVAEGEHVVRVPAVGVVRRRVVCRVCKEGRAT